MASVICGYWHDSAQQHAHKMFVVRCFGHDFYGKIIPLYYWDTEVIEECEVCATFWWQVDGKLILVCVSCGERQVDLWTS